MSSSVSEICPRSILRYRPLDADAMPVVSAWKRPTRSSRTTKQRSPSLAARGGRSSFFSTRAPGSLATVVGLGMCLMLVLIVVGQWFIGWTQMTLDDWRYGRPRTFQADVYVGQEATRLPSHFLALNNHGQVEIIEFPGNDPSRARIFLGPHLYGANAELMPVTLRFLDSQHTHHPNMLVACGTTSALFLNRGGTFQLDKPNG
ncbi:MAG: hypothetical protein H0U76_09420 [Ktedonobacteraceae bacterium]|nr:hypothetical protein [Ktedonobacteraceae bacterium]